MKLLPYLIFFLSLGLQQDQETVAWHPGKKLRWVDFRGVPDRSVDAAATTVSALSYTFNGYLKEGRLVYEYDVKALFFPEKSWVREDLKDEELLLHEQLHFDITAWYAAKLRRAFDTIAPSLDPQPSVKVVYEQVRRELDSVQALYDKETNYSLDLKEQLLWESRIKQYLEEVYE
ncbi:hypothetical protein [Robertkochia sediminum]|uniref:hypothetical protein n=1 Tax=Robertkochia sediminum TaxID=2785326 RepID=UPI001934AD29|nr:hypothetical protein [Robertkochia sediminum]MBL7472688.1 hypothetical protein [Robertkochia sediminum]